MNDNKQIQVAGESRGLNYDDPRVRETIRQTVAVGATDAELAMFLELAKSTGMNPFKKEIWFIKVGNRPQIMTGINGFLSIANSHIQFDGMTVEVDSDDDPKKAVCKVYRKDRKFPAEGVALLKEYRKDTPIWKQMPRVMLTKVAKSIALREAFPQELGGLNTAEEMPPEFSEPRAVPQSIADKVKPADTWEPTTKPMRASGEYWYDLSKISDDKRAAAIEYADGEGAAIDPDTGLYLSKVPLKKLHKAQVAAPQKGPPADTEDDIPESWKSNSAGAA
jgi:phage recombination protein Bet